MMRAHPFLHAIAVILLSAANISWAEERFEVIDYCPSDWEIAWGGAGLNITKDAKKIVGSYTDTNGKAHGLIIKNKKCSSFDYPGAHHTYLGAANTRGELVGWNIYYSPAVGDLVTEVFLYRNGKFNSNPLLFGDGTNPREWRYDVTVPTGITSRGEILANRYYDELSAVFLFKGGKSNLLPLPGTKDELGSVSSAGINDKGVVVGSYAQGYFERYGGFIFEKGKVTTIKYPGTDGSQTQLTGINNKNEIVGHAVTGQRDTYPYYVTTGFLYRDGKFKTIMVPGSIWTTPTAISDKGSIIVGTFLTADGKEKAFLYYPR